MRPRSTHKRAHGSSNLSALVSAATARAKGWLASDSANSASSCDFAKESREITATRNRAMNDAIQLLPIADVARRLALSVRSVRTLIALGKLPAIRVSTRAVRVAESDLCTFIAARRTST